MVTSSKLSEIVPVDNHLSETASASDEPLDQESSEKKTYCGNRCCSCFNRWWNCEFKHQHAIVRTVEKNKFHLIIIILVLIDCLFVIGELVLDFVKLKRECDDDRLGSGDHTTLGTAGHVLLNTTAHSIHTTVISEHNDKNHGIELAIEILHYGSIIILSTFVIEITVKIYGFGRDWWNIHHKKMEWLDASIVIVSFIVDVILIAKSNAIAEISLLLISVRLWRFVSVSHLN